MNHSPTPAAVLRNVGSTHIAVDHHQLRIHRGYRRSKKPTTPRKPHRLPRPRQPNHRNQQHQSQSNGPEKLHGLPHSMSAGRSSASLLSPPQSTPSLPLQADNVRLNLHVLPVQPLLQNTSHHRRSALRLNTLFFHQPQQKPPGQAGTKRLKLTTHTSPPPQPDKHDYNQQP